MKCVIVGGGIGGLSTAVALHQQGIDAVVCESAPELRAGGAGIWMPSNSLQVLDRLGLAHAVLDAGHPLRRGEVHDVTAGVLQVAALEAVARSFGFGTVAIHRARLQRILAEAVPGDRLRLGRECTHVDLDEDGVRVRFRDGSVESGDVLIGADGLRSGIRAQLFPTARLRYSGQTSYRGVARMRLPESLADIGRETWARGCRLGFSAVAPDEVYWFAVEDAPAGGRADPDTTLHALRERYARFPAPATELLERTGAEGITRTDIFDLRPLPSWSAGRAVLIGDAAHATTPNLGQGGAQAVEDAWVLADCLARHQGRHARAFAEFESRRRARVQRVVTTSWYLGKVAHLRNPLLRAARNALIRATPDSVTERQFRALFELGF